MSLLCPAVGDVVAVCVLLFLWLDRFSVACGRYSESMVKFVKHIKSSFFTTL